MSRRRGDPHRQRPGSQELLVSTVASAPDSSAPIDAVAAALEAASAVFQERRESARHRQAVVAANAELRERELIKLASAIVGALRRRGVGTGRTSAARTPRRFARRLDQ
jgi:acyl-CoA reductase-like NAD-dependent aldehyde dehydrogenase